MELLAQNPLGGGVERKHANEKERNLGLTDLILKEVVGEQRAAVELAAGGTSGRNSSLICFVTLGIIARDMAERQRIYFSTNPKSLWWAWIKTVMVFSPA